LERFLLGILLIDAYCVRPQYHGILGLPQVVETVHQVCCHPHFPVIDGQGLGTVDIAPNIRKTNIGYPGRLIEVLDVEFSAKLLMVCTREQGQDSEDPPSATEWEPPINLWVSLRHGFFLLAVYQAVLVIDERLRHFLGSFSKSSENGGF